MDWCGLLTMMMGMMNIEYGLGDGEGIGESNLLGEYEDWKIIYHSIAISTGHYCYYCYYCCLALAEDSVMLQFARHSKQCE